MFKKKSEKSEHYYVAHEHLKKKLVLLGKKQALL